MPVECGRSCGARVRGRAKAGIDSIARPEKKRPPKGDWRAGYGAVRDKDKARSVDKSLTRVPKCPAKVPVRGSIVLSHLL